MPYYMDIHRGLGPVTPTELDAAHLKDLEVQDRYGVRYRKYWLNQDTGTAYCLMEGPDREACEAVHAEAHGLVADAIIPVEPELVDAFLGTGKETPIGGALLPDGCRDTAFRVLLVTRVENLTEVSTRAGDEAAAGVLEAHHGLVRTALESCGGREVRDTGEGVLASFVSASDAVRCAVAVQRAADRRSERDPGRAPRIGIALTAGEPVEKADGLFGVSVSLAHRISERAGPGEILVTDAVRSLSLGRGYRFRDRGPVRLRDFAEPLPLFAIEWAEEAPVSAEAVTGASPAVPRDVDLPRRVSSSVGRLGALARELRRRKVFRVAAVYLAAAFVVLQVASLTIGPLGIPAWTYNLVLVLAILCFPLAVVVAWAFELAPGGEIRPQSEAPDGGE